VSLAFWANSLQCFRRDSNVFLYFSSLARFFVFFVFGQVYALVRIELQVVQFLVIIIDVAGVLVVLRAEGLGFGDCFVLERMLVEKLGPPFGLFAF